MEKGREVEVGQAGEKGFEQPEQHVSLQQARVEAQASHLQHIHPHVCMVAGARPHRDRNGCSLQAAGPFDHKLVPHSPEGSHHCSSPHLLHLPLRHTDPVRCIGQFILQHHNVSLSRKGALETLLAGDDMDRYLHLLLELRVIGTSEDQDSLDAARQVQRVDQRPFMLSTRAEDHHQRVCWLAWLSCAQRQKQQKRGKDRESREHEQAASTAATSPPPALSSPLLPDRLTNGAGPRIRPLGSTFSLHSRVNHPPNFFNPLNKTHPSYLGLLTGNDLHRRPPYPCPIEPPTSGDG
eukprot:756845-Hanusia_phi.AAC.7